MILRMCPEVLKNISELEKKLTELDQEEVLKIVLFFCLEDKLKTQNVIISYSDCHNY